MLSVADIASEMDEGLKQLFQAGLELSLQVQASAKAAEPAEQARLSLTFHRLSRGVRQTAALRVKLALDAQRGARETAAEVIKLDERRLARRKAHVKAAVECLIWTEAESPEALDALKDDLADLLEIETQDAETFTSEPLDAQIARLCQVIGLPSTLPIHGEGGPSAERSEERMVEGASQAHCLGLAPSTTRSAASGPPPPKSGEVEDPDADDYWRSSA